MAASAAALSSSRIIRAFRPSMGSVKVARRPLPRALCQETAARPERHRLSTGVRASTGTAASVKAVSRQAA